MVMTADVVTITEALITILVIVDMSMDIFMMMAANVVTTMMTMAMTVVATMIILPQTSDLAAG
jgi:hypothetical protein